MKPQPQNPLRKDPSVQTDSELKQPNERDESIEAMDDDKERPRIKRAYDDLQEGQVDTDLRNTSGVDSVVNNRPDGSPEDISPPARH